METYVWKWGFSLSWWNLGTDAGVSIWASPSYNLYCPDVLLLLPFPVNKKEERYNKIQYSISLNMCQLLWLQGLVFMKCTSQFGDLCEMQKDSFFPFQIVQIFFSNNWGCSFPSVALLNSLENQSASMLCVSWMCVIKIQSSWYVHIS